MIGIHHAARRTAAGPSGRAGAALLEQGWRKGDVATVISDGDPALARAATKTPVEPILNWFHLNVGVLIDDGERCEAGKPISARMPRAKSITWSARA